MLPVVSKGLYISREKTFKVIFNGSLSTRMSHVALTSLSFWALKVEIQQRMGGGYCSEKASMQKGLVGNVPLGWRGPSSQAPCLTRSPGERLC